MTFKTVQQTIIGRLADSTNVNSIIITDLSQKQGDRPVIQLIHIDGTETLIVLEEMRIGFDGKVKTIINIYRRFNNTEEWNSLDDAIIDTKAFPFGRGLVTTNNVVLNTSTFATYSKEDLNSKDIYTDENGNLKAGFSNYYDYLRYGTLGLGIEQSFITDITKRFNNI